MQYTLNELQNIVDLIKATIPHVKKYFTTNSVSVEEKSQANYVTNVDIEVQNFMEQELKKIIPTAQFIGEEGLTTMDETASLHWVLDPIDGTTNFIHNFQSSTVAVALVENNTCILSVVYNPFTDEIFHAILGGGAFLNDEPIQVSKNKTLAQSIIAIGFPYDRTKTDKIFNIAQEIFSYSQDVKRKGPASLDLCYVACGRIDGYFEFDLEYWDYLGGELLIKEAGGQVSTYSTRRKTSIVATSCDSLTKELKSCIEKYTDLENKEDIC